jgi:hypothetical protein
LVSEAQQERTDILSNINTTIVGEIKNDYKYANVKKPFEKIHFKTLDDDNIFDV